MRQGIFSLKHRFPLRLVYEDAYGHDWVKYVDEIVVI
jgi:DMSO/TMAO reductase YedYZ molybdopterin-dependent catalytic subunit